MPARGEHVAGHVKMQVRRQHHGHGVEVVAREQLAMIGVGRGRRMIRQRLLPIRLGPAANGCDAAPGTLVIARAWCFPHAP